VYTDDPDEGGVAVYNDAILCELARLGYDVTCVQSESQSPMIARQRELGVKHYWLGFHSRRDCVRSSVNMEDADRAFSAASPDVVVFTNCSPFSHIAAKTVAIRRNIPFIVVEGYVAPLEAVVPEVAWYLYHLEEHYKRAKAVIAVSQDNLDLLHRQYRLAAGKGDLIHYGRPASFFEPQRVHVRQGLRREVGIPEEAVVCLTVGRLEPVKGHGVLVDAVVELQKSAVWPRLYFAWIGSGSLEGELKEMLRARGIGEHVKMLGQRWDVAEWLDASDVFALPSFCEGMPLVIMEAMAKGLPVLASSVSGIPEELGDAGKLLPSPQADRAGTVREIVSTLNEWTREAQLRCHAGQICRNRAEKLFREERMLHRTMQVIERAVMPPRDYISPGLEVVRPDPCFPHLGVGDPEKGSWQHLRRGIPHNWYVDRRAPDTGFANRDEAHILYNMARRFEGKEALEIGCWLGWSVCHLALGGVRVDVIDPVLARPDFRQNIEQSLDAAGVRARVNLVAGLSPSHVHCLSREHKRKWPFFFIDGNHEAPYPVFDAAVCAEHAEDDAVILFHDLASPDVAHGLEYLRQCGWNTLVYMTAQIMGVAWRGAVEPIHHVPDPSFTWHVPNHLRHFTICGM